MALLLNKYPNSLLQEQFDRVLQQFIQKEQISLQNYNEVRQRTSITKQICSFTSPTVQACAHFPFVSCLYGEST